MSDARAMVSTVLYLLNIGLLVGRYCRTVGVYIKRNEIMYLRSPKTQTRRRFNTVHSTRNEESFQRHTRVSLHTIIITFVFSSTYSPSRTPLSPDCPTIPLFAALILEIVLLLLLVLMRYDIEHNVK